MDKYIYDEKNGLWYELQGDYYLPCLKLPEEVEVHIGIWGQHHRRYLKEHRKIAYTRLLTVKVDGKDVVANKVNVSVATFVDNGKTYNKGMAKAFNAKAISNDGSSKVNTLTVETFAVAKVSYVGKD